MNDYIVRATAADGQVRAFAATTKELVEAAREHHNTSPVATAALGRLLTAGAMMGSMMKNDTKLLENSSTAVLCCPQRKGNSTMTLGEKIASARKEKIKGMECCKKCIHS